MSQIAICFEKTQEEPGYPVAMSGFQVYDVAEDERKRLRRVTHGRHELCLVEYDPRHLKGGYILAGKVLPKRKPDGTRAKLPTEV